MGTDSAASLADKLIDYIKINRVSTTELTDAYGKKGLLDLKMRPVSQGIRAVGKVFYAPSFFESNWFTHLLLQDCPAGHVVVVDGFECGDKAIFGSLVAKYALLYRQAAGIVVAGNVRDAQELIKQKYPIWSYGVTPIGCFNRESEMDKEYFESRKAYFDGGVILADDSGVVFIPKEDITEAFFRKVEFIELQESIWFDCIDRKKLSTFETVCLRKFVNDPAYRDDLAQF